MPRPTRGGLRIAEALIISVISHPSPWEPWPARQEPGRLPTISFREATPFRAIRRVQRPELAELGAWHHVEDFRVLWDSPFGCHVNVYPHDKPLERWAICNGPFDVDTDGRITLSDLALMQLDPHDWNEDGAADIFDAIDFIAAFPLE